jgi:hypothetical protein
MAKPASTQSIGNNSHHNQQAGRDINYFNHPPTTMRRLIEAYEQERLTNTAFNDTVEQLDRYLNPSDGESGEVIGLEKKLQIGHFDSLIPYAMEAKDIFARKFELHRFSKAAQEIFLYILADIWTSFYQKIYLLICNDEKQGVIMEKVQNEIVEIILQKLEDNVLKIYADSISGMIYFLTGNCHIKWSKE